MVSSVWARCPNDPEAKGLVERANGYLETSFLPGRSFEDISDFNRQLGVWLRRANQRIHDTTRVTSAEAIFEDLAAMMVFPRVLPDRSWRHTIRLPRDHYIRVDTNDYSVNPRYLGPVLSAGIGPLRTSLGDRHLQQTLRTVGRSLWRPRRRRSHDRPAHLPRRSRLPQRRLLPAQRPRPEERAHRQHRVTKARPGRSIFNRCQGVNFQVV